MVSWEIIIANNITALVTICAVDMAIFVENGFTKKEANFPQEDSRVLYQLFWGKLI